MHSVENSSSRALNCIDPEIMVLRSLKAIHHFYRKLVVPSLMLSVLLGLSGMNVLPLSKGIGLSGLFIIPFCHFMIYEILIIIYSRAEFILLDEPFNGLSPVFIEEIKKHIIARSQLKGFIISDHDYEYIMGIATKNLLLFDGGIKEINDQTDLQQWGYLNS